MKHKLVLILMALAILLALIPTQSAQAYTQKGFDDEWLERELQPAIDKLSEVTGIPKDMVLQVVFGDLNFRYEPSPMDGHYHCWASLYCEGEMSFQNEEVHGILLHELGHRFVNLIIEKEGWFGSQFEDFSLGYYQNGEYVHVSGINPETGKYERTLRGLPHYKNSNEMTYKEDYADMFMHWLMGNFDDPDIYGDTQAGKLRNEYMNEFVLTHLKTLGFVTQSEPSYLMIIDFRVK